MLKYTLKRIGAMIPVMLIISAVVFLIIYLTPGDPASSMLGMEASADQIERVNESLGLNEPLPQRYLEWMGGVLSGDLGDSYFMHQPVTQAIAEHFGPTLSLAILAQLIALLIALPCGVIAALKHGSRTDAVLRVVALLGVAIPGFLMALMLMCCSPSRCVCFRWPAMRRSRKAGLCTCAIWHCRPYRWDACRPRCSCA